MGNAAVSRVRTRAVNPLQSQGVPLNNRLIPIKNHFVLPITGGRPPIMPVSTYKLPESEESRLKYLISVTRGLHNLPKEAIFGAFAKLYKMLNKWGISDRRTRESFNELFQNM